MSQKSVPSVPPPERWLTIAEAASYMRLCQQSVRSFIHSGELRASRLGAAYRLDKHIIDEFMVRRERVVAPYRKGTKPWVAARHERNRRKATR